MKIKIMYFTVATFLLIATGCKKWLDINSDPDTTQEPSNSSVLPPLLAAIPTALQADGGLYIAKYTQNWLTHTVSNNNVYDIQGFTFSGGTMGATWNMIYYAYGRNLEYLLENSKKKNENDFLGVALALKAWAYQHGTDYHSDLAFYEAFKPDQFAFKYDNQETIYRVVDSMCRDAIVYLNSAIDNPANTVGRGDLVYGGDLRKWKKFVFGVLARNYNHLSKKTGLYRPDSVIKYCDSALAVVADDFCVPFDATVNNNANYFGTFRDNMTAMRQSNFIVRLLDGTIFSEVSNKATRDPRLSHMLTMSHDTTNGNGGYRGVDPAQGDPYSALAPPDSFLVNKLPPVSGTALTNYNNARKKVAIPFGDSIYLNPGTNNFGVLAGKYLFKNKAVFPVMTASEIQFIKAEAAFLKGETGVAYNAYKKGIELHFDFINRDYGSVRGSTSIYNVTPISAAERTSYLASSNVKKNGSELTLSDIMEQKYIALWGWGFVETWTDMKRYDYYEIEAPEFENFLTVYKGFVPTTTLDQRSNRKMAQKVRPHYTSEFTYNLEELRRVGITENDWHVTRMWFTEP